MILLPNQITIRKEGRGAKIGGKHRHVFIFINLLTIYHISFFRASKYFLFETQTGQSLLSSTYQCISIWDRSSCFKNPCYWFQVQVQVLVIESKLN